MKGQAEYVGEFPVDAVRKPVELGVHGGNVGLIIDGMQHHLDRGPQRLQGDDHEVRGVVGAAALPDRAEQARRDHFDKTRLGARGDQADSAEPASNKVGEDTAPGRPGPTRRDSQPERFTAPTPSAIRNTRDFDSEWIPIVFTRLSIRRVESPAR